jgi:hypothetical protein
MKNILLQWWTSIHRGLKWFCNRKLFFIFLKNERKFYKQDSIELISAESQFASLIILKFSLILTTFISLQRRIRTQMYVSKSVHKSYYQADEFAKDFLFKFELEIKFPVSISCSRYSAFKNVILCQQHDNCVN